MFKTFAGNYHDSGRAAGATTTSNRKNKNDKKHQDFTHRLPFQVKDEESYAPTPPAKKRKSSAFSFCDLVNGENRKGVTCRLWALRVKKRQPCALKRPVLSSQGISGSSFWSATRKLAFAICLGDEDIGLITFLKGRPLGALFGTGLGHGESSCVEAYWKYLQ